MPSTRYLLIAVPVLILGLVVGGTGTVVAHGLITTGDIKNGAVTKKKIKNHAVNSVKIQNRSIKAKDLAPSAKGAKVRRYVAPGHDFDATPSVLVELPGTLPAGKFVASTWEVQLVFENTGTLYVHSLGANDNGENYFHVRRNSAGVVSVYIFAVNFAEMESITVFRTTPTHSRNTVARPAGARVNAGD